MTHAPAFEFPQLGAIARRSIPNLLEATIVPLGLFLLFLKIAGLSGALAAGLVWGYGAVVRRLVARQRVPGILVIGVLTLSARTAIAFATHSVFIYFLQPTLGTILLAAAFLLSVPVGKPLAERLAHDFCPLPDDMVQHPHVRRFFHRISLLWAFVFLANAAITIWLLVSQSVETFVFAKSFIGFGLTGPAILVSVWWFKRTMSRHGLLLGPLFVRRRTLAPVPVEVPRAPAGSR